MLGLAQILSATSCWNISVSRSNAAAWRSQRTNKGEATLYGRLATTCRGSEARSGKSILIASASITRRRPPAVSASSVTAPTARRSSSMAVISAAGEASRERVRPPGPGPTSITWRPVRSPVSRTIRSVRLPSSRKCWPREWRAARPCRAMTSRRGGSTGGGVRPRRRAGRCSPAGAGRAWPGATAVRHAR